jgi:hypothetical protein
LDTKRWLGHPMEPRGWLKPPPISRATTTFWPWDSSLEPVAFGGSTGLPESPRHDEDRGQVHPGFPAQSQLRGRLLQYLQPLQGCQGLVRPQGVQLRCFARMFLVKTWPDHAQSASGFVEFLCLGVKFWRNLIPTTPCAQGDGRNYLQTTIGSGFGHPLGATPWCPRGWLSFFLFFLSFFLCFFFKYLKKIKNLIKWSCVNF